MSKRRKFSPSIDLVKVFEKTRLQLVTTLEGILNPSPNLTASLPDSDPD